MMVRARRFLGLALGLTLSLGAAVVHSAQEEGEPRADEIRSRLRAEAGVRKASAKNEDLPLVAVTVLPGDTYEKLSADLTGSADAVAMLKKIQPRLSPGHRIFVPRTVLSPNLSDARMEPVPFGEPHPTLWTLTRLVTGAEGGQLGRAVRNIQRLNGILDPGRLSKGTEILVPRSLLAQPEGEGKAVAERKPAGQAQATALPPEPEAAPAASPAAALAAAEPAPKLASKPPPRAVIRRDYLAGDTRGLERRGGKFSARACRALSGEELEQSRKGRGDVGLVVIHTTEHSGATFENTAAYIQRRRLANYLIGPDGAIYEVIPDRYRAFGCGDSLWEGRYNVDLEAINIEIFANTAPGGEHQGSISETQYEGLRALLADIRARRPEIHDGRIVTHRMVSMSFKTGARSRKGDPYEFDWAKAGLPDNSEHIDQDVLLGRVKLCTDERYADRVTPGQATAAKMAAGGETAAARRSSSRRHPTSL